MPIRRLNYTARRRIRRTDAKIMLRASPDGSSAFEADLRLAGYDFPPDARVIIEAYRQTYLMRFELGTVSVPVTPAERKLAEFDSESEVLFRVRVTAASGRPGVLLGEADRLRPVVADNEPDKRMPLLPPVPGDIGEEVWRIEFEGNPILRVNSRLPDWRQTVLSDTFRALVYPEAFRQVLQAILLRERYQYVEDLTDWRSCWLLFASRIPGAGGIPRDNSEYDEWIENAVETFARQFTMRSRFEAELMRNA